MVSMLFICRWNVSKHVAPFGDEFTNSNYPYICFHSFKFTANISVLDSVVTQLNTPKPTQVDLMEKLCKKLKFKYENKLFANPMLASFYSNLEALVYDEAVAEVEDVTLPRCDDQDKKLINFIDDITEEFGTVIFDNGIRLLNLLFIQIICIVIFTGSRSQCKQT